MKYGKSKINDIFYHIECIIIPSIIFVKMLCFQHVIQYGIIDKIVMLANLGIVLIIAGITFLFNRPMRFGLLGLMDFILTFILVSDIVYYRYYSDVISIPLILQVTQLGFVKSSVFQLVLAKDLFWFADIICLVFLWVVILKKKSKLNQSYLISRLTIGGIICIIGFVIFQQTIEKYDKAHPNLLTAVWSRVGIVNSLGALPYHAVDACNFLSDYINEKPFSDEEKENIAAWFEKRKDNSISNRLYGVAKGKNLIVVQVEALQEFVINRKVYGHEITPNLNKLVNEGLYFNNFYPQVSGGNTSDAEFLLNVSLFPAKEGVAFNRFSSNSFESLPLLLKEKGYRSYAMHANKPDFWNREIMYKNLGYDDFFHEGDYVLDQIVAIGLSDESFLRQSIRKIKDFKEPYYAMLVTLSSHYPFEYDYGNFNVGEYEGTVLGNYLKAIHYADKSLGEFFNMLRHEGILEKSLLVVYGDHHAIPHVEKDSLFTFLGVVDKGPVSWVKAIRVPLIIRLPKGEEKGVIDKIGGEIDLKPTILNMMGVEDQFSLGNDLFAETDKYVLFPNGSYIKGNYYYYNEKAFQLDSGKLIQIGADQRKDISMYRSILKISNDILVHNYIETLKVEFTNDVGGK